MHDHLGLGPQVPGVAGSLLQYELQLKPPRDRQCEVFQAHHGCAEGHHSQHKHTDCYALAHSQLCTAVHRPLRHAHPT